MSSLESKPEQGAAYAESVPDIPTRIRTGLSAGFRTSLRIIAVSVPLYVGDTLPKGTPVLDMPGGVSPPGWASSAYRARRPSRSSQRSC